MRSYGTDLDAWVALGPGREPRMVIELRWNDLNLAAFTSHGDITWTIGGNVYPSSISRLPRGFSQDFDPERYRSTGGGMSFTVTDRNGDLATEIAARLSSGLELTKARCRFYLGFRGPNGPEMSTEAISTLDVERVSFDDASGTYTFRCHDGFGWADRDIIPLPRTETTTPLLVSGSGVSIANGFGFEGVSYDANASEAAGLVAGYAILGDEIVRYTSAGPTVPTAIGPTSLSLARERFGTVAEDYSDVTDIQAAAVLDGRVVDLICAVITGSYLTGPQRLPDRWHLGKDRATQIDVGSFEAIGADVVNLRARLVIRASVGNARSFIEKEFLPLIGCFMYLTNDGRVALRRVNSRVRDASTVLTLDRSNSSIRNQTYDPTRVVNQIQAQWTYDEGTREYLRTELTVDTESIARHGPSRLAELRLRGLHADIHTSQHARVVLDRMRARTLEPPWSLRVQAIKSAVRLEPGDVVRVVSEGMPDFAGDVPLQINRSYEVRRVQVDLESWRVNLDLESPNTGDIALIGGGSAPVMQDSYYTSAGTSVAPGNLSSTTFSGGADINDPGSIWYVDGDLAIPAGVVLVIERNVQLRVRGLLTIEGTIDGSGRGNAGGLPDPTVPLNTTTSAVGEVSPGISGFVGPTQASAAQREIGLGALGSNWTPLATNPRLSPLTTPANYALPELLLINQDGLSFSAIPSDLQGSSGGAGQFARFTNPSTQQSTYYAGGNGGASGAGLAIVCRGLNIGVNGRINLNGNGGGAAPTPANAIRVAGGAGGAGGGCYVFLDGAQSIVQGLERFSSITGVTPYDALLGDPPDAAGISAQDNSAAHLRYQFIPAPEVPRPINRVTDFFLQPKPADILFAEEDLAGNLDFTAINADSYRFDCLEVRSRRDVTGRATFALAGVQGVGSTGGSATVTVDPSTGVLTFTDILGRVIITVDATIGNRTKSGTLLVMRVSNGFLGSRP